MVIAKEVMHGTSNEQQRNNIKLQKVNLLVN